MVKQEEENIVTWIKSATQNSVMFLIILMLFYALTISTKNKININFSKKENKRVLYGIILYIAYIYRDSFEYWFNEIQKDAEKPGTGFFGQIYTNLKTNIVSLNSGYLGDHITSIAENTQAKQTGSYEVSDVLKNQLKSDGAIGYLILKDNKVFSIKSKDDVYFLESKIQRDTMTVQIININRDDLEYNDIFLNIIYIEIFDETIDSNSILVQPNSKSNNDNKEDICSKCNIRTMSEVEADKYSTVSTVDYGELPKCFKTDTVDQNGNPIYSCCIIEQSGTKYTCPDICFDFPDGFNENKFSADEYVDILKTNEFCSNIELTTKPDSYLDVIRI